LGRPPERREVDRGRAQRLLAFILEEVDRTSRPVSEQPGHNTANVVIMTAYRGKSPVLGWSLHMTGGWQSQFNRVERWYERSKSARVEHDRFDFLLAFFENSLALRDWLKDTGAVKEQEINSLFSEHVELRINRDLANSFKHHSIDRPSQEQPPSIAIEYAPERPTFRTGCRLVILSEGETHDALALAGRCLEIWRGFLNRPRSKV
jgi:hypothetical protein